MSHPFGREEGTGIIMSKNDNKKDFLLSALMAADAMVTSVASAKFFKNLAPKVAKNILDVAKVDKASVKVLPIFDLIQKTGNIPERDMYNTYNMGVGMSIVVAKEDVEKSLEILKANGEDAYIIGEIIKSDEGVILC
jgi:phosphoribosylformylglycinamidine cyclo-ligase